MPAPDLPLASLLDRARRWRALDPDPEVAAELDDLVARAEAGDPSALADAFGGRVGFGTAGLRAEMGPGPARMNRVVVRRATAGLLSIVPPEGLVLVGHDARRRSDGFAADAAGVVAAAGRRVVLLGAPVPTPLVAFGVRRVGAEVAAMITASHNPPGDNGYKVYLADGAQIAPPTEGEVAAAIDEVADRAEADGPEAEPTPVPVEPDAKALADLEAAYVESVVGHVRPGPRALVVAYTAMHGVGRDLTVRAFAAAGFEPVHQVAAQCDPDGDFPTVRYPNPEEAGALDQLAALADEVGADVGLAQDPDADRLGVLVPRDGGWARLTGDETGVLLADHLLAQGEGADRLVVRTIVSSRLLDAVAAHHGATCAVTLTGFKNVMGAARARPELRFVMGYEEALGYAIGDDVRDKDGIAASVGLADLAARLRAEGRTLDDRLAELARRHGLHRTDSRSVRFEGREGPTARQAAMERLRADPPSRVAGLEVVEVDDLAPGGDGRAPADVVVLELAAGAWMAVRPSGTEPKLKVYAEVVVPVGADEQVAVAATEAGRRLEALHADLAALLGLPGAGAGLR